MNSKSSLEFYREYKIRGATRHGLYENSHGGQWVSLGNLMECDGGIPRERRKDGREKPRGCAENTRPCNSEFGAICTGAIVQNLNG